MSMYIALGYQSRVGKDIFADHIINSLPNWYRISIADPLYDAVSYCQQITGKPVTKNPDLLQGLGTMMRNVYGENVWLDLAITKINKIKEKDSSANIIITDVRLSNEKKYLESNGFVTIKITRPNRPIDRNPQHISEIDLANSAFDYTINNDGSLDDYISKIDDFIATQIKGK